MSRCCFAAGFVLWAMACVAHGQAGQSLPSSWPYYRGPDFEGHSNDTKVPLTWSEKENIAWKTKLPGRGNSSPIVAKGRIFLTAASKDGNERYVLCISAADGKTLWQKTASKGALPGRTHAWNGYASPSCATDGERVYGFFGTPGLFCYDLDGNLLWKHDFGIFTSLTGWGTAASPFLFEDLLIQNCDNDGAAGLPKGTDPKQAAPMALVALDKYKGTVRWITPRNQGRGFSTPRLHSGTNGVELILNGPRGVWSYDPHTGKEIWFCERTAQKEQAKFGELIPTVAGGMAFAPSGRPGPFQAIKLGGTGNVSKTHLVWEKPRKGRDVSSQIIWGEHLYACDNKAVLTCYDWKTGNAIYTERLAEEAKSLGSPVAVRGKLLFLMDTGETVVLEPGSKLQIVGRNILGDNLPLDFAASPAIVDGRMYIRSQAHLYCIGEK